MEQINGGDDDYSNVVKEEIENVVDDDGVGFDFGYGSDFEYPPLVFADVVFFEWKYQRIFPMAMPPSSEDEIVEEITEPRVHSRRRQTVPLWDFLVDERIEELESEAVVPSEVDSSEVEEEGLTEAKSKGSGMTKRWRFKGFFRRGSSSRSSDVSEGSCCSSSGEARAAEKVVAEEGSKKKGKKKEMKRQKRMSFG